MDMAGSVCHVSLVAGCRTAHGSTGFTFEGKQKREDSHGCTGAMNAIMASPITQGPQCIPQNRAHMCCHIDRGHARYKDCSPTCCTALKCLWQWEAQGGIHRQLCALLLASEAVGTTGDPGEEEVGVAGYSAPSTGSTP